jgi:hypothetical protein
MGLRGGSRSVELRSLKMTVIQEHYKNNEGARS